MCSGTLLFDFFKVRVGLNQVLLNLDVSTNSFAVCLIISIACMIASLIVHILACNERQRAVSRIRYRDDLLTRLAKAFHPLKKLSRMGVTLTKLETDYIDL